MPIHVSRREFERLVTQALDTLPEQFRGYLANIVVEVHDRPQPHVLAALDLDDPRELLGFYHGVPITEQSVEHPGLPEYIYLYQPNIEAVCDSREDLIEQVRVTVLHEIGHHMGLDEDDLADLGYG